MVAIAECSAGKKIATLKEGRLSAESLNINLGDIAEFPRAFSVRGAIGGKLVKSDLTSAFSGRLTGWVVLLKRCTVAADAQRR